MTIHVVRFTLLFFFRCYFAIQRVAQSRPPPSVPLRLFVRRPVPLFPAPTLPDGRWKQSLRIGIGLVDCPRYTRSLRHATARPHPRVHGPRLAHYRATPPRFPRLFARPSPPLAPDIAQRCPFSFITKKIASPEGRRKSLLSPPPASRPRVRVCMQSRVSFLHYATSQISPDDPFLTFSFPDQSSLFRTP